MKAQIAQDLYLDIDKAPHVLIAGTTGMGKSAFINALICDLATRYTHKDLRMLLIDPKRVELSQFKDLPHLLAWPAMEIAHAADTLHWACKEMDDRFRVLEQDRCRSIDELNEQRGDPYGWPRILIVVDEMASLLLDKRHGKTIEGYLVRIATLGRAAGIHLVLATQTPRADVITGLIRANVPTRIAFGCVTRMESLIILDQPGAEKLPHPGDMLARLPGSRQLIRAKGTYLEPDVVRAIVAVAERAVPTPRP